MGTYLERASYTWSEDSVRLIHTASGRARSRFFYVQEAGYFQTKPPYFTERENLNSYLIVHTVSGRGVLEYMGRKYPVRAGETFYIHCMPHHYYACAEGQEWEIVWLHFNGESARGYFEEFIQNEFHIAKLPDPSLAEGPLRRILALIADRGPGYEVRVSGLIVGLLTELLVQGAGGDTAQPAVPEYIRTVLRELERHFLEPFSLDRASECAGVSKYHLSREFRRHVGSTIHEYVITLRLNYAKELLRYTDQPVGEIAFACGMNHVSHFIHLFLDREGMTPLKYRKEWSYGEGGAVRS